MAALLKILQQDETAFLDEIQLGLYVATGRLASPASICRAIYQLGFTRKMIHKRAMEACPRRQQAFRIRMSQLYCWYHFLWMDEAAADSRTTDRGYAYAPKGLRSTTTTILVRGRRYTVIGLMSAAGMLDWMILEGSCNAEVMLAFANIVLAQHMNPFPAHHSILIMDNCLIHHNGEYQSVIRSTGGFPEFLPPYSPLLNPIEKAWSKMKAWLKRNQTYVASIPAEQAIHEALCTITRQDCVNWIRHCGPECYTRS